jgi:hypothetical protein
MSDESELAKDQLITSLRKAIASLEDSAAEEDCPDHINTVVNDAISTLQGTLRRVLEWEPSDDDEEEDEDEDDTETSEDQD